MEHLNNFCSRNNVIIDNDSIKEVLAKRFNLARISMSPETLIVSGKSLHISKTDAFKENMELLVQVINKAAFYNREP
jgi:hypothetical protein